MSFSLHHIATYLTSTLLLQALGLPSVTEMQCWLSPGKTTVLHCWYRQFLMRLSNLQTCLSMTISEDGARSRTLTRQIERPKMVVKRLYMNMSVLCPYDMCPYDMSILFCCTLESILQVMSVQVATLTCPYNYRSITAWMIIHTVCGIISFLELFICPNTAVQFINNGHGIQLAWRYPMACSHWFWTRIMLSIK